MIRLINRRLIIPRGDTGSFTVPLLTEASLADVSIFTIFDCLTHKKMFNKVITEADNMLTVEFTHEDTVNLVPGKYVWDIKFYKNPVFAEDELISGEEVHSYYAGFTLPVCEIKETGDTLLTADNAPTSTMSPQQLNVITSAISETNAAKVNAAASASAAAGSAADANASATSAASDASSVSTMKSEVEASAAQVALDTAATTNAKNTAVSSAENASTSATAANASATSASASAATATTKANEASASATAAENAKIQATAALSDIQTLHNSLAQVATSGDYEDLINKPTIPEIPANISAFYNDVGYLTEHQDISGKANSADLATVATSGNYSDLSGTPTIPDIQIDGTSIIENGAANIPYANSSTYGLVRIGERSLGINPSGTLVLGRPYANEIKAGTLTRVAIDPANQHESTFYGLAKAAGDTSQSQSENAVGTYTANAKTAIQNMLDVPSNASVTSQIGTAIGNVHQFNLLIAQALPVENIDTHTIYLVPKTGETNDVYDEYVYINNAWEMIGNTQIDLSNYVQKTDYATSSNAGVVKVDSAYGLSMLNGYIRISPASTDDIKAGINNAKTDSVAKQHASTFYGLAKAAGDTTQSQSDNAIGTYTNEAKAAIQTMLDVPNKAALNTKAPVIYKTVTGSSLTITDAIPNLPLKSLTLTITGDPTDVGTTSASVVVSPSTIAAEGTTYTKSFDAIYEGTLDFISGKLTITKAILDLGSIGYNYNNDYHYFFSQALYGIIDTDEPIYSSDLTVVTPEEIQAGTEGVAFGGATYIYVYNNNYVGMTIDQFKAAVTGKCIAYSLRTPRVVQLSAGDIRALSGTTYISSEDGSLSVEYLVDTKSYVDAGVGSIDLSGYATKADTELTTTLSRGRKENTAIGTGSFAFGYDVEASGNYSHAEGNRTKAAGSYSNVHGVYNVEDSYSNWPEWVANTEYVVGDKVKRTYSTAVFGYICKNANSDATFKNSNWAKQSKMNYAEIIGNGTADNARSNARALDWDGNEHLMGDVYVHANADSSGGSKLAKVSELPDISGKADKTDTVLDTTLSRGRRIGGDVGSGSFAFGFNLTADGQYSHAEGHTTQSSGQASHSEGRLTYAKGNASHAEGYRTTAYGEASHASGMWNVPDSYSSWDEWVANTEYSIGDKVKVTTTVDNETTVTGYICKTDNSDAEFTVANWTADTHMNFAEIIGNGSSSNDRSNARALSWEGNEYLAGDLYVHANNDSSGGSKVAKEDDVAIIPGIGISSAKTKDFQNNGSASYSAANGIASFASGRRVSANGDYSQAFGNNTAASGNNSHAEGSTSFALATGSHAEGRYARAKGDYSHAEGMGYVNSNMRLTGDETATTYSYTSAVPQVGDTIFISNGEYPYLIREVTAVDVKNSILTVNSTFGIELNNKQAGIFRGGAVGTYSHTEGVSVLANSRASHAEGEATNALGDRAHAEGYFTKASGNNSHAEGQYTTTMGSSSHSEGFRSLALGDYSHAEGANSNDFYIYLTDGNSENEFSFTFSVQDVSPKVGDVIKLNDVKHYITSISNGTLTLNGGFEEICNNTQAILYTSGALGYGSHVEGTSTIAHGYYQHVQGKYNIADTDGVYADIVGNGTKDTLRSNAYTLDWSGNGYYAGDIYINCSSDSTGGEKLVNGLKVVRLI